MELIQLKEYNNIYAVAPFREEFKDLFGKSQNEYKVCQQKLAVNLRILDQIGLQQALTYPQFEKLENEGLYSIRYVSKNNPRVIFAHISEYGRIILLTAFKEKRDSDYRKALKKAKDRMKELEE